MKGEIFPFLRSWLPRPSYEAETGLGFGNCGICRGVHENARPRNGGWLRKKRGTFRGAGGTVALRVCMRVSGNQYEHEG